MNFEQISPYILTIILAWFGAHVIKYLIYHFKGERYSLRSYLFMSGGMPSGHSATVVAMATLIGYKEGFGSGLFGLAALFALIVMYDAVKVRRSSGEQGEAIKKLIKETKSNIEVPRIAKGHTPPEVVAGSLLGALIGLIVFLSTK